MNQKGQTLILMVVALSLISTMAALFALDYTRRSHRESMEQKRAVHLIYTLNATARWIHSLYYYECNCDPYVLNNRINQFNRRIYKGTIKEQGLDENNAGFEIIVGEFSPAPSLIQAIGIPAGRLVGQEPPNQYNTNQGRLVYGPQDVSVTFWLKPYGRLDHNEEPTRYEQTITLINTCTTKAPVSTNYLPPTKVGPQFGSIFNIAAYNGLQSAKCGNRIRGSVDQTDSVLDVNDRIIFQNWLKNSDTAGALDVSCNDLNNDGLRNEIDLNILEKSLKGYLHLNTPSFE